MMKKESDAHWRKLNKNAVDVTVQDIFTQDDKMRTFAMKRYIIGPQGYIGNHSHPWEHVIYVLEGAGTISGRDDLNVNTRCVANVGVSFHIPVSTPHNIKNPSLMKPFIFLSIIPIEFEIQEAKDESI